MNKLKAITAVLLVGLGIMTSCKKEAAQCTITADRTAISGVAAQNPAAEAIVITTDAAYWIVTTPSWISADPVTAVGGGNSVCTLTIGNNYKDANTDVAARSGEVKFSGGGTSLVITVSQEGYTAPVDPSASIGGIPSKEEFTKFVAAVNSGKSIDRWLNKSGEVELLSDLDLSDVTPWTAIGAVESVKNEGNACSYEGNAFKGKFNGGNHTVSGVNITTDLAEGSCTGFFGVLDGATVKDLKLKGSMTLSAAGIADAGFVAGTSKGATISNVSVEVTVKSTGSTTTKKRFAIGGIAGFVYGDATAATTISGCSATVTVDAVCGSNTENNATCCMFGGIAGFSSTDKAESVRNIISDCKCSGEITASLGRCSGICASCNYGTYIKNCTNNANQVNTIVNGRIASITCILGGGKSGLENCVNNGNITTSDSQTTTAAMVALLSADDCFINGGGNYGTIVGANTSYLGLIAANFSKFASIADYTVGGQLGVYSADGNHKMYEITADNFNDYLGGGLNEAKRAKITGLVFGGTPGPVATPGIASAADLKEFADLVNAGGDYSKFVSDGAVVLKADIDLAGAEWTPIGKGSTTTAAVITDGDKPFTGVFDGKGHTIDNFKVTVAADAVSGYSAGLFGILSGATVKNVVIGSKAVLSGESANISFIGSVAGYAVNSTIENCTNNAKLSLKGAKDNIRECLGGIVGQIYTTDAEGAASYVKLCTNSGVVTSTNTVNTKNGATGLSVGGIVGFSDGKKYNYIQNCTNKVAISAQATRLAGIVASANTYTKIEDCTNEGKISGSDVKASNSRVAGICSAGSTEVYATRCINRGDVEFSVAGDSTHGYAAGIFGQTNNPVVIDGCENYGAVLSDMYKGGVSGDVYMGIILANASNKAATIKNCKVGGKIGPVSEDETYKVVTIDASNFEANITLATSKAGSLVKEANSFATK